MCRFLLIHVSLTTVETFSTVLTIVRSFDKSLLQVSFDKCRFYLMSCLTYHSRDHLWLPPSFSWSLCQSVSVFFYFLCLLRRCLFTCVGFFLVSCLTYYRRDHLWLSLRFTSNLWLSLRITSSLFVSIRRSFDRSLVQVSFDMCRFHLISCLAY